MKRTVLNLKVCLASFSLFLFVGCSEDECAECHVVADINGTEYELMELGEYCEDALHDIEEAGYTIQDTLYLDAEGDSLPSMVLPGSANEVHCGEEHDH
jgi:hypothetical protein